MAGRSSPVNATRAAAGLCKLYSERVRSGLKCCSRSTFHTPATLSTLFRLVHGHLQNNILTRHATLLNNILYTSPAL